MELSIAMITYNQERFIAQAVESVLAQKVDFEYEIVFGEDCSTDGTRSIVADFSRRYPGSIVPLLRERNLRVHGTFAGRWLCSKVITIGPVDLHE
jgi:glycosyltransferase involved in cell wall biosynthesis